MCKYDELRLKTDTELIQVIDRELTLALNFVFQAVDSLDHLGFLGRSYFQAERACKIAPWSIWISYSLDLRFWGESQLIMRPEPYHWDEMKIGPGAPPIKTDQGWLSIYHGVFQTMDGSVYRLGVALHDLQNPAKIIGVGDSWILQPEDSWEVTGYVHNVVFTCGAVPESDGTVKIYWGGADTVMCAGEANISDLVTLCLKRSRSAK